MKNIVSLIAILASLAAAPAQAVEAVAPPLSGLKAEAAQSVEAKSKLTQVIVDKLFSFSELAFQEFETQAYLVDLLEKKGFTVERENVSDMPSGWWATWSNGKGPVIALGTDVDGIPKSSQMPGVAYRKPIVEGAPGHGEGHNSGQGVNITAALAVKEIMEREGIKGTIVIWPGIAEELVGGKAYFARDGRFKDVDAVLFTHVSSDFNTSWGTGRGTGLVSVQYTFNGSAAHGAGDPWKGKSALDAVELMNVGWNYKREHLHYDQRSHYVIVDGGDQPNVVPATASVWYFIREMTAKKIRENFAQLENMAKGAALMTGTSYERRIIGSAWPRNFNKPLAEAMYANIQAIGMPDWDKDDQSYAKAVQKFMGNDEIKGLKTEVGELQGPPERPISGGSDDIGDVSWNVPTITLRYPSNINGVTFHHWSSSMAMATPIAHKGATVGAKAMAATMLDLLTKPDLLKEVKRYFKDEQLGDISYEPFISKTDKPAIEKNREIMSTYKPLLAPYYYDETQYDTYLDQLGVNWPQLKEPKR